MQVFFLHAPSGSENVFSCIREGKSIFNEGYLYFKMYKPILFNDILNDKHIFMLLRKERRITKFCFVNKRNWKRRIKDCLKLLLAEMIHS